MTDDTGRVGTNIVTTCGSCEKPVPAKVAGTLVDHGGEAGLPTLFQLASCLKCGDPLLAIEEDYGNGWDEEPVTVWPQAHQIISPLIPESLRRQHSETHKCFSIRAYTATVVMVRRTLEGICIDQGAQGKTLMQMLEHLAKSGKIEGRFHEWSQALRALGNEGAHFSTRAITAEDAADAVGFTEALMDYIYVYSKQFEQFKQRRQNRDSTATGD
ncbi:DUF4145 domain-containing protein [Streptomyces sp. F8]|uniref:DUF4145 domain-containing protein n=1 Tax=Streptomyces sp. F8 TaxID=1436085 RepID=UPI0029CC09CE|nr:DUF4145 domain-containing protein [Streptomyces sp. F8]MDX6760509.1 DUF4145 domain-containing protein [Streptomyces sp. F8]